MLASTILLMRYLLGWSAPEIRRRRAHRRAPDRRQSVRRPRAGAVVAVPGRDRGLRLPDGGGQHVPVPAAGRAARDSLPGWRGAHGIPRAHRARDEHHHAGAAVVCRRPPDPARRRRQDDRRGAAVRGRGIPADRRLADARDARRRLHRAARRAVRDRPPLPRDALHDGRSRVEVQGEERQRHAGLPHQRLRGRQGARRLRRVVRGEPDGCRLARRRGCARVGGGRVDARPRARAHGENSKGTVTFAEAGPQGLPVSKGDRPL